MAEGARRTRSLKTSQILDRHPGQRARPGVRHQRPVLCWRERSAREHTGRTCFFQPEVPEAHPCRLLPSGARVGATEADSVQVILASSSYETKGAVHPLRGFLRTELFLLLTQPERGSGFLLDSSPPSNKSAIQKPHKNLDFLFLFKSNFSFTCFLIQFQKLNNHYTLISLQPGGVRDLTTVFYEYGDWDH